jgi:hypothetical protein
MKREPDFFGDREVPLIYVARNLKDALRLEGVLTAAGVDYAVETDKYVVGTIFRRERVGAFFYVLPESEASARETMRREGFRPYEGPTETARQSKG